LAEIGKEAFRVFDAVRIYEALQNMTAMQPVVVNPKHQLHPAQPRAGDGEGRTTTAAWRDQFLAKLQRKKRHLSDAQAQDFETRAGMPPDAFIRKLRTMPLADIAAWFTQNPDLGETARPPHATAPSARCSCHDHADAFDRAERGYGKAKKPEDYLKAFSEFIKSRRATQIPGAGDRAHPARAS
jgi:type I restriction enzyme R subunit